MPSSRPPETASQAKGEPPAQKLPTRRCTPSAASAGPSGGAGAAFCVEAGSRPRCEALTLWKAGRVVRLRPPRRRAGDVGRHPRPTLCPNRVMNAARRMSLPGERGGLDPMPLCTTKPGMSSASIRLPMSEWNTATAAAPAAMLSVARRTASARPDRQAVLPTGRPRRAPRRSDAESVVAEDRRTRARGSARGRGLRRPAAPRSAARPRARPEFPHRPPHHPSRSRGPDRRAFEVTDRAPRPTPAPRPSAEAIRSAPSGVAGARWIAAAARAFCAGAAWAAHAGDGPRQGVAESGLLVAPLGGPGAPGRCVRLAIVDQP